MKTEFKVNVYFVYMILATLIYFGFSSEYDLAFCRWFIYCYEVFVVGLMLLLGFMIAAINKIPYNSLTNEKEAYKAQSIFSKIFGAVACYSLVGYLFTTNHILAANIYAFIMVTFSFVSWLLKKAINSRIKEIEIN